MVTKFKILPVVALGLFWMASGNEAHSNVPDCGKASKQCNDEYSKNVKNGWNACELYKDPTKSGGAGKAYIACCEGSIASKTQDCKKMDCISADQLCNGPQ